MSSDGGLLALREIEARLRVAGRLAACLRDLRAPERIRHSVAEMLRFRLLMIAAAYEDGNDADSLRHDPVFKLANGVGLWPSADAAPAEEAALLPMLGAIGYRTDLPLSVLLTAFQRNRCLRPTGFSA